MSGELTANEEVLKHWTAKRRVALVLRSTPGRQQVFDDFATARRAALA